MLEKSFDEHLKDAERKLSRNHTDELYAIQKLIVKEAIENWLAGFLWENEWSAISESHNDAIREAITSLHKENKEDPRQWGAESEYDK